MLCLARILKWCWTEHFTVKIVKYLENMKSRKYWMVNTLSHSDFCIVKYLPMGTKSFEILAPKKLIIWRLLIRNFNTCASWFMRYKHKKIYHKAMDDIFFQKKNINFPGPGFHVWDCPDIFIIFIPQLYVVRTEFSPRSDLSFGQKSTNNFSAYRIQDNILPKAAQPKRHQIYFTELIYPNYLLTKMNIQNQLLF